MQQQSDWRAFLSNPCQIEDDDRRSSWALWRSCPTPIHGRLSVMIVAKAFRGEDSRVVDVQIDLHRQSNMARRSKTEWVRASALARAVGQCRRPPVAGHPMHGTRNALRPSRANPGVRLEGSSGTHASTMWPVELSQFGDKSVEQRGLSGHSHVQSGNHSPDESQPVIDFYYQLKRWLA